PDGAVWRERQGAAQMARAEGLFMEERQALDLAAAIAGETQGKISEKKPLVSGKILVSDRPIRAQIVYPPVIEGGPSITLRRYNERKRRLITHWVTA
ncbi:MAG: ATPase, T2SS/T4P/T4SS family, partial [Pseudomonadota bacterium]